MTTLEEHLAEVIAEAFWETAQQPRHWSTMSPQQRQVFRNCAVRAVTGARAFRDAKSKQVVDKVRG